MVKSLAAPPSLFAARQQVNISLRDFLLFLVSIGWFEGGERMFYVFVLFVIVGLISLRMCARVYLFALFVSTTSSVLV